MLIPKAKSALISNSLVYGNILSKQGTTQIFMMDLAGSELFTVIILKSVDFTTFSSPLGLDSIVKAKMQTYICVFRIVTMNNKKVYETTDTNLLSQ